MDKASDFESEDCGFDPRQGLAEIYFFSTIKNTPVQASTKHIENTMAPKGFEPSIFALRERRLTTWPRSRTFKKVY